MITLCICLFQQKKMADELKQKFKEMQKNKENKKEIDIDEFEWIKVV